jgi:hypothetical protein
MHNSERENETQCRTEQVVDCELPTVALQI